MPLPPENMMDTLSEQLAVLQKAGYTYDFNLSENGLICKELDDRCFLPEEFTIVGTYRFEGMSYPGDNSVLYAIEGADDIKGTLVDAYGAYADPLSQAMIEKFRVDYNK
ncbi:MAG: phosphoribosylpyrophosphate synthetase [Bacteroidota bacterium]